MWYGCGTNLEPIQYGCGTDGVSYDAMKITNVYSAADIYGAVNKNGTISIYSARAEFGRNPVRSVEICKSVRSVASRINPQKSIETKRIPIIPSFYWGLLESQ